MVPRMASREGDPQRSTEDGGLPQVGAVEPKSHGKYQWCIQRGRKSKKK